MLKELIRQYGKNKINTLTKYPSILTLHKLGEKGRLTNELSTNIDNEILYATEKIDGTNVRIICLDNQYLVGSREFILHHCDDLYFDTTQGIIEGLRELDINPPETKELTVIYGEFYGGKTSSNSKWYGRGRNGFRVFDVAIYKDLSILDKDKEEISKWRERETNDGIIYGQNFLTNRDMKYQFPEFEYVPILDFCLRDLSHKSILDNLEKYIPETLVSLSDNASKRSEGLILRNESRSKIVKVRFEDYERTLR